MQLKMHDENECECKELNDWSPRNDFYMWNPSNCDCECKKACQMD